MKPFDLEAAKRGEPIQTHDGRAVRFVGHVPEAREACRVVVLVAGKDSPVMMREDGRYGTGDESPYLFMASRTVYVNLYRNGVGCWHASKEDAERGANAAFDNTNEFPLHTAVPVEI